MQVFHFDTNKLVQVSTYYRSYVWNPKNVFLLPKLYSLIGGLFLLVLVKFVIFIVSLSGHAKGIMPNLIYMVYETVGREVINELTKSPHYHHPSLPFFSLFCFVVVSEYTYLNDLIFQVIRIIN